MLTLNNKITKVLSVILDCLFNYIFLVFNLLSYGFSILQNVELAFTFIFFEIFIGKDESFLIKLKEEKIDFFVIYLFVLPTIDFILYPFITFSII
jgi:hypothetical protein